MEDSRKAIEANNGTLNDPAAFMQNGVGGQRFSASDTTAKEISNFRRALPQFLAVSAKNILLFGYGMTLGFPTIVIPAIQGGDGREPSDIVLNKDQISWFSSINLITVPLGCLFSGLLTQPIGKRKAMQIVNLPILASWLLFHFSTKTEHLYAALCLSGLGGGLMEAPVLTYVAEITDPEYRGILSALGSTCVITGVFVQFLMGSLMDWRTIAAVSSAFPVIAIIALCFVPESPHWLIRKQRFREAIKSLQWLRGWVPEYMIESEFNRLYDELITQPALEEAAENAAQKPTRCNKLFRIFRKRSFLVPFLLITFTFFAGHFSGKTSLQTYAVQIFHTLKAPINKYHATILLGVAEMIATIICVFLIHFTGKRPLVLVSTIGVGICFFVTATYAHYLNVVPGFAVNNVVVNASSIVPKESIISQSNITKIFETQEHNLMLMPPSSTEQLAKENMEFTTNPTTINDLDDTTLTTLVHERMIREAQEARAEELPLVEQISFDYITTPANATDFALDELLADEDDGDVLKTTLLPIINAETTTKIRTPEKITTVTPTNKEVVNEILIPVPEQKQNNLVWLPLIFLLGAAFFAHLGIRMIPWILIGEVFPAPVRSTASGLASGLGYIFGFLANKLFLQMLSLLTLPGTFWFYASVAFTGTLVLYFVLPETEGRTLGEIEAHFSKKSDTNLLSKKWKQAQKEKEKPPTTVTLNDLHNLHIPLDARSEAKIIQLQQSDLIPQRRNPLQGNINQGFESNTTTHL